MIKKLYPFGKVKAFNVTYDDGVLQDDVLSMTTIEIIDYLKAMSKAEITDSNIINNSGQTLWFSINGNGYDAIIV